jgi:hypothetical protein
LGARRAAALGRRRDPGWVARREKIPGDFGFLWEARINWYSASFIQVFTDLYIELSQVYLLALDKYNYLDRADLLAIG